MRTRMSGGVTGKAGDGLPMSIVVWGGESCLQPPFGRLFRAMGESDIPQAPAESRLRPGLAAPQLAAERLRQPRPLRSGFSCCRAYTIIGYASIRYSPRFRHARCRVVPL